MLLSSEKPLINTNNNNPILSNFKVNFDSLKKISPADIINTIPEKSIYEQYLGSPIKRNKLTHCCFHDDTNPSMSFYRSGQYLKYKCFGCGESGNIFNFVSKLYSLSYWESVEKIITDFNLRNTGVQKENIIDKTTKFLPPIPNSIQIHPTFRNWTIIDYNYWTQFGISLKTLGIYQVKPCEVVYFTSKSGNYYLYANHSNNNPIYHYNIDYTSKIYRPLSKNKAGKWLQNSTAWEVQGLTQLPNGGELLLITSSLKDVMALRELGYYAIAPQGEGTLIPDKIMDYLHATWKKIVLFYDSDKAGITYSKNHSNYYDLKYILLPVELGAKDISDCNNNLGIDESKNIMNFLLQQIL